MPSTLGCPWRSENSTGQECSRHRNNFGCPEECFICFVWFRPVVMIFWNTMKLLWLNVSLCSVNRSYWTFYFISKRKWIHNSSLSLFVAFFSFQVKKRERERKKSQYSLDKWSSVLIWTSAAPFQSKPFLRQSVPAHIPRDHYHLRGYSIASMLMSGLLFSLFSF